MQNGNYGMTKNFKSIYDGKTVLITGHTGFKGSWLALWLKEMGAKVIGYSLEPKYTPNHFELLNLDIVSIIEDIRDREKLNTIFQTYEPEIVFHLAAQPLVRYSYNNPVETFDINVMGTVNVLETCRIHTCVKAIINVTSDKCYENKEWLWGYREDDAMGGYDPYSASKGASELISASYRNSFFNKDTYNKTHQTLLATCRAGNVIGGGDWSEDRLIPDIVKSIINKEVVEIRSPNATRPWQHVLEPLSGYLLVGQKLLEGDASYAQAWNFGPNEESSINVKKVLEYIKASWNELEYTINEKNATVHEATLLKLDCSKAYALLQWQSKYNAKEALEMTMQWYKSYYSDGAVLSQKQLNKYTDYLN